MIINNVFLHRLLQGETHKYPICEYLRKGVGVMKCQKIILINISVTLALIILYFFILLWIDNVVISLILLSIIAKIVEFVIKNKVMRYPEVISIYSITGCIIVNNISRLFRPNFDYTDYISLYIIEFFVLIFLQCYYFKIIDVFRNSIDDKLLLKILCKGNFKKAYLYALVLVGVKFVVMYLQSIILPSHSKFIYLILDIFVCGFIAALFFYFLKTSKNINQLFYFYVFMSVVLLPGIFWTSVIWGIMSLFLILSW